MQKEKLPFGLLESGLEWICRRRVSQTSGQIRLPGLISRVEVFRDQWGVPHIYAENVKDLFFAQGFVHAQDRFWQMEFQRRLAAGRLSEIFGDFTVSTDYWMRVLGLRRAAEEETSLIQGEDRAILNAFSAGVNAFLGQQRLPVEFSLLRYQPEPWAAEDTLSWSKMIAWMLSANWESELLRQKLIDRVGSEMAGRLELDAEDSWPYVLGLTDLLGFQERLSQLARPWTGPTAGEGVGSNNWVVAGSRTASGKPILANDMHMLLSHPPIWYENHLVCGDFNCTGISLPGIPLIVAGHNGHVAWGFTAGYSDVQDLFEEHLQSTPGGGVDYEYQGEWIPAEVRREEIRVRGSASIFRDIVITRHGPVITPLLEGESDAPLALKWTAYESSGGTFRALVKMNRARNCLELREAMRTWNIPTVNVVYADVDGNIAYSLIGKVPIRRQGQGKVPVPGWTDAFEWIGYIPYDEMPHLYNPPSGYVATANNRVASPDYPYWLGWDYVNGDRAERIIEMILEQPVIDVAYIKKMQRDQVSPSAQTMAWVVSRLHTDDPRLKQIIERMRRWDGTLAVDSPEAAIYEALTRETLNIILSRYLGELSPRIRGRHLHEVAGSNIWGNHTWEWLRRELLREDSPWFDLGNGETRDEVLLKALNSAVDLLTSELGPEIENWTWGHFHQVRFNHILGRVKPLDAVFNRGPYPIGGDGNTIWATASLLDRMHSSDGMVGPPFRFIADLSDLDHSLGVLAPGQSGEPGSPHYDDQLEAWFNGEYHPMFFRRDTVEKNQQSCLELLPW